MTPGKWAGRLAAPPYPPELPAGARPRWPAWSGFAAMGAGTAALIAGVLPVLPVLLVAEAGADAEAIALLVLILLQDTIYVGAALAFARISAPLRPWHLGLRATPAKRTIAITVAATVVLLAFEIGYIELLGIDEGDADDLTPDGGVIAALAVSLAVIVVAPVTEEIFFRGFLYRGLRNRIGMVAAALLSGTVFGALHFSGWGAAATLPVIATFGITAALVYEWTGNLFAPIAIHAAFNTLATVGTDAGIAVPLAVGLVTLTACLVAPRMLGSAPSPFHETRAVTA